jgi:chromosome segregation ATPase
MSSQPAASPRESSASSVSAESLETLRQLTVSPLDEITAPKALAAILEALHLRYGALLRYDSESQSLAMVAQEGLAEQAIGAIRLIRRGASGVWDMPLHAVLQRRVYIIDRPKENPFVPTLLQGSDLGVLTNAAVMPLFAEGSVTGALLLVGSGKRAIHESDIVKLREAAKNLGTALRLPSKLEPRAAHVLTQPISAQAREESVRDRAMLKARISELESLVESLRRTAGGASSATENERRLADMGRERDRYKSEAALHEIALRNLRAEYDLIRDQSASEAERGRKLALELAREREGLAAAVESGQRSAEELEQANRSRTELGERLGALERQLGETAKQVHTGEAARAEIASRLSVAERDAEELRKSLRAREEQISELRGERERLTASLQKAAARYQVAEDATAQLGEGSEIAQAELRGQIEALQARVEASERERDQLSAGLAGRSEIVREIERETERFRTELAREVERRRVAEQTASSVIHDAAALRVEAERVQAERQMAHAEAEQSRTEAQQLAAELDALRKSSQGETERLRQQVVDLQTRAERAESMRKALAAEVESLRPDLESHRKSAADLRSRDASRQEAERTLQAEVAELRDRLQEAAESARALSRERDALLARAATLQETTANLLRDGEALRAERDGRDQELESVRSAAEAKAAEAERLRAEVAGLRGLAQGVEADLGEARGGQAAALERAHALESELASLRGELERAQSRGSELTVELARRAQLEESLQAAVGESRRQLEDTERRRLEEELQRNELEVRLQQLEQQLQGASADLAEKAREIDFASVLRATLAKSESARRAAEEAVTRLEAALDTERQASAQLRLENDSERESAHELARRLEELGRRLDEAEAAIGEADQRAESIAAERGAAQETTQSLAAELGRRTAELGELSSRLESAERDLQEREAAAQRSLAHAQTVEQSARTVAQEIEALKRQSLASQDEKDRRIHELELRGTETTGRAERMAVDLKAGEEERERLRESVRALENERRQASETIREGTAKSAALEAAVQRSQAESERLVGDVESARQQAARLENDLRGLESESARWRSLAEKLQGTIEERDREIQGLKSAAPRPPVIPPPATLKPVPAKLPAAAAAKKPAPVVTSFVVAVLDEPGPAFSGLAQVCGSGGFEARAIENGGSTIELPAYTAVNLLATKSGGLEGLVRSRTDEGLAASRLFLYAARPGGPNGVVFGSVDCLIRPIEEKDFLTALTGLLGNGKRVTIIGEELDSVLKLNAWATAKGCSVSSAGDLKQGNEILDIVKPDLIVFDFSRLGGEGAGLVVKARRSARLEALPMLLVLPQGAQSPSAAFFMKRMATLADESPLDFTPILRRLAPAEKI